MTIIIAAAIMFAVVLFLGLMILGGTVAPAPVQVEWNAEQWKRDHSYQFRTASVSAHVVD